MECKSENVCRLHSIFCAENATINKITITTTQIYMTLLSGKLRKAQSSGLPGKSGKENVMWGNKAKRRRRSLVFPLIVSMVAGLLLYPVSAKAEDLTEEQQQKWDAFWGAADAFGEAAGKFEAAMKVCWGEENDDEDGILEQYDTAADSGVVPEALYKKAEDAVSGVESAYSEVASKKGAVDGAFAALGDDGLKDKENDAKDTPAKVSEDISTDFENMGNDFKLFNVDTWKARFAGNAYFLAAEAYWEAEESLEDAVYAFWGNGDGSLEGKYPKYMEAYEAGSANVTALYKEAKDAYDTVLSVYKDMKAKYEAVGKAYTEYTNLGGTLNEGAAADHATLLDNFKDATDGAYKDLMEADFPAPPGTTPEPTPTPAPTPSSSGSSSASASVVKTAPVVDWNAVSADIQNAVAADKVQSISVNAGTKFQVSKNVLDQLTGSKTALFLATSSRLAFSVSGWNVEQETPSFGVALSEKVIIPEPAERAVQAGAVFSHTFAMEDKSSYPVIIGVHLNVGKEYAGKNSYLYYYDELTGSMKLAGSFTVTDEGQTMFALTRGDEYIVVIADNPV